LDQKHQNKILFRAVLVAVVLAIGLCILLGDWSSVASGAARDLNSSEGRTNLARAGEYSRGSANRGRQAGGRQTVRAARCSSASSCGDDSDISVQVEFDAPPAVVRNAINTYVKRWYPQAVPYMKWDDSGTSVSASNLGASGSITLTGSGTTLVTVTGDIGFPASLFVSEKQMRQGLNHAIRDITKRVS
jgi:hypothetical protein